MNVLFIVAGVLLATGALAFAFNKSLRRDVNEGLHLGGWAGGLLTLGTAVLFVAVVKH